MAAPKRRALVVGVQHPLDAQLPRRPGTCAALRRVASALEQGGWAVQSLLDDAADDGQRPIFSNLLEGLSWLAGAEVALLVLSAPIVDGRIYPRDGRGERTTLRLDALELPGAFLWLDGVVTVPLGPWGGVLAALPAAGESSAFLRALALALVPGPQPLGGRSFLAALHASVESVEYLGKLPEPLLFPATGVRTCVACSQPITDPGGQFCPHCGTALTVEELLDNGRFRLVSRLGAGGMGQVFLAEDTRLKVRRAIKLLSVPSALAPAERELLQARLVQEARAAQVLSDLTPHVVRVFDVGHAPERGEPYLVMELLEGETLAARLARGRLPFAEALAIGQVVAQALAMAHARGFIHRDLKPDNVMLCHRDGDKSFVKLLDFGLVKAEQAEVRTESGRMMGTLQYMPPEQLRGQPVDARADVFALGAVLHECFTGRRANPGRTQPEIFALLLDRGVPPLVAPDLPKGLCDLIDACLKLNRDLRPAHAGVVAALLAPVTSPGVLSEQPTGVFAPTLDSADVLPLPTVPPAAPTQPMGWKVAAALAAVALGVGAAMLLVPTAAVDVAVDLGVDAARAVVARPQSVPEVPLPPDAARPQPLVLPKELLPTPQVERALEGVGGKAEQWILYRGTPAAIASALVRDRATSTTGHLMADAASEAQWAALPPPVRQWMALGTPLTGLVVEGDGVKVPLAYFSGPRPSRTILNGIGMFWGDGARPPVAEATRCGVVAVGDRLFTARWSMPGYSGGQCTGPDCLDKLERALQKARSVGERLQATLTVVRGDDEARLDVACSVGP